MLKIKTESETADQRKRKKRAQKLKDLIVKGSQRKEKKIYQRRMRLTG